MNAVLEAARRIDAERATSRHKQLEAVARRVLANELTDAAEIIAALDQSGHSLAELEPQLERVKILIPLEEKKARLETIVAGNDQLAADNRQWKADSDERDRLMREYEATLAHTSKSLRKRQEALGARSRELAGAREGLLQVEAKIQQFWASFGNAPATIPMVKSA